MAMRKGRVSLLAFSLVIAGVTHMGAAWADGPEEAYGTDPSLSPNEYKVNVDGMKEDPNAPMSDKARAYRNGLLTGRAMQKVDDEKASGSVLPPIPHGAAVHDTAVVRPVATQPVVEQPLRAAPPPAPVNYRQAYAPPAVDYAPPPDPEPVYAQEQYYAPQPQPAPVVIEQPMQYVAPPPVQYVYPTTYVAQAPVVQVAVPTVYAGWGHPVVYAGRWGGYGGRWGGYGGWRR
ncbi:hypothetical protein [Paraburkholderia humisilvae]|uniref:Uncharacterized protein n=1 Tax=Paraburkholderia humisilvae TaxID=627669 RepID=A0A6J5DMS0_9BURK|nr:hypothetical protein [Paraburkholderia humisilvae]CAB3754511.1 hypothetical protein LMG29542_02371 [Paraburkholderia humisilvae]